jgi:hypothetical protein
MAIMTYVGNASTADGVVAINVASGFIALYGNGDVTNAEAAVIAAAGRILQPGVVVVTPAAPTGLGFELIPTGEYNPNQTTPVGTGYGEAPTS